MPPLPDLSPIAGMTMKMLIAVAAIAALNVAPTFADDMTKDAWFDLADRCSKNRGGNDCWKVTSDISPALRDALKGDYRGYVNRCNDHKGDESACNIVATMTTTLFIAGCRQPHHLDTDDWTCSGVSDASQFTVARAGGL
jgi:hypothetical protein